MSIDRRRVLKAAGVLGATAVVGPRLTSCSDDPSSDGAIEPGDDTAAPRLDTTLFAHGVASGDPLADAVVVWTRITTENPDEIEVEWQVSNDADFSDIVARGLATTGSARDHTVKVDVTGLDAATTYHYRFVSGGRASPVGITRTTPNSGVDSLRFGVVSCSNLGFGYFHAYRHLAERDDLDAVLHLGDYIYEYGEDGFPSIDERVRADEPLHEIITLDDYRTRYAHYRTDGDLQQLHAAVPWITVWDDHETANNSWRGGAQNHDPATEGPWSDRLAAATQAYFEWMPIRDNPGDLLYRRVQFGDLVDLLMLDTRIAGRQQQSGSVVVQADDPDLPTDLLGPEQEAWLETQLVDSAATWRVLGQQVTMGLWRAGDGVYANEDSWAGYPAARSRLLGFIGDNDIDNVVVLTGDVHSSWAMDVTDDAVPYDPATGEGSFAVEFVTPGVTSPSSPAIRTLVDGLRPNSPHLRWADGEHNGFVVLEVTPNEVRGTWYFLDGVGADDTGYREGPTYLARNGSPTLVEA